ncbi:MULTISPECIES: hypothetical protein [Streptomycetaceae]|uniref:hypothetical protein n=1 Tax=Streptomycetaceae TaxID=2062 RepID=UPI001661DD36|nr:hypothetical protein [Streptomyces sp. CBMA123]MBD0688373.1 hypothetical protein [Streptomyces sp. CBMA123]
MTRDANRDQDDVEPSLELISTFDVRHANSDVDNLVDQITELLSAGTRLVDLSHHDRFGTIIELRAQTTGHVDR